ncbi:MAG TPA: MlaD family protein [Burkholderiales bacterium]|nr:MlaD family protein [Burkholderiales bacterium]
MEADARYTLVGATLIALVVAAVGALVWLKSSGSRQDVDRYTIYFQRQSLDGLQVGADVTMLGVSVGRVEAYTVDRRTMNRVRVTIRVVSVTPVTPQTEAIVQRNILTGIARIALTPPAGASPALLTAVSPGEDFPVIPEGQSDIDQIAGAANRMAKSGAIALDNINELLSVENRIAFTQTLAAVRDITSTVNARMDKLDELTLTLTRSAADVGRASRDVAEQVRLVQGAATPAVSQLESTLRDASRTLARVERESAGVAQRFDAALEVSTLELGATTREIRATAEMLARTADRFAEPRALLFGPSERQLGPGERLK